MRDVEKLLKALVEEPWHTLMALADLHEEEGDAVRAAGYRYFVEKRRRPLHQPVWVPYDPPVSGRWRDRNFRVMSYRWRVQTGLSEVENTLPVKNFGPGDLYDIETSVGYRDRQMYRVRNKRFGDAALAYAAAAGAFLVKAVKVKAVRGGELR